MIAHYYTRLINFTIQEFLEALDNLILDAELLKKKTTQDLYQSWIIRVPHGLDHQEQGWQTEVILLIIKPNKNHFLRRSIIIMQCKQLTILLLVLWVCSPVSLPLHNGIFSPSGEYTVSVQLGTPPQTFEVQVDTGSFKLAVPCAGCSSCEGMLNPLFNSSASSSFSAMPCDHSNIYCDDCAIKAFGPNTCILKTVYQDNSQISGDMSQDLFFLPGMTKPISTPFGCITSMNKQMVAEGVDGIWGVGRSDIDKNGAIERMDQLVTGISAQIGNSSRIIAFCLAVSGGVLNIGSVDTSLHTQPAIIVSYDAPGIDLVGKNLSISLEQFPMAATGSYSFIIIDSGTTTSIFNSATFNAAVSALDHYCQQMGLNCLKNGTTEKNCYQFPDVNLAFSKIPPIAVNFGGNVVNWHAEEYLAIHNTDLNQYCLTFSGNDGGSYMFGDDFMLNKDVVFGENQITIYPMSKCSGSVPTYAYQPTRRLTIEENSA